MTGSIVLRVTGVPITQGSKTAILIGGRPRVVEGKGAGRKRHADWRADVAAEARRWQEAHGFPPLLTGPLSVMCLFALPKPASAPKRARTWPIKARSGDIDKLARSILDSCTGTLWVDDSQVVRLLAEKDWGDPPGVLVTVRPVYTGGGVVAPTPVRKGPGERECIQPSGPADLSVSATPAPPEGRRPHGSVGALAGGEVGSMSDRRVMFVAPSDMPGLWDVQFADGSWRHDLTTGQVEGLMPGWVSDPDEHGSPG